MVLVRSGDPVSSAAGISAAYASAHGTAGLTAGRRSERRRSGPESDGRARLEPAEVSRLCSVATLVVLAFWTGRDERGGQAGSLVIERLGLTLTSPSRPGQLETG